MCVPPGTGGMTGADVPDEAERAQGIVSKRRVPAVRHRVAGPAAAGVKSRRATIVTQIPIVGSGHETRQLRAGHQSSRPPAAPLTGLAALLLHPSFPWMGWGGLCSLEMRAETQRSQRG